MGHSVRGLAITHSMRIDGSKYGIYNIYDACLATKFIFNFSSNLSFGMIWEIIKNTIDIYLQSRKHKVIGYPDIE